MRRVAVVEIACDDDEIDPLTNGFAQEIVERLARR
jgi:hypothetical protein